MTDDERDLVGELAEHLRDWVASRWRPFKSRQVTEADIRRQAVLQLNAWSVAHHFTDDPKAKALSLRYAALRTRVEAGEVALMTPEEWDRFVGTEGLE